MPSHIGENEHMTRELSEVVQKIGKKGGASVYARAAAKALELMAKELEGIDSDEFLSRLEAYGSELIKSQPSMASVINAVEYILNPLRKLVSRGGELGACKRLVLERSSEFIKNSENAVNKIARFGANLIRDGDTILTHSYSSTVLQILRSVKKSGKHIEVIVTESRPKLEGRELASELLKEKIPITLIIDAAICTIMDRVNKVLVGADSILADGSIINKVGTFPIALAARLNNVPFIVAAEFSKFNPFSLEGKSMEIKMGGPKELIDQEIFKNSNLLKIWNPIFEVVPSDYITLFVTDLGVLPPQAAIVEFKSIIHGDLRQGSFR